MDIKIYLQFTEISLVCIFLFFNDDLHMELKFISFYQYLACVIFFYIDSWRENFEFRSDTDVWNIFDIWKCWERCSVHI